MPAEEPDEHPGSKTQRPKRHANSLCPSNRSIPDLINDPANQSNVKDVHMVHTELERKFFITPTTEIMLESLTTALLDFSIQAHSLTPMHIDVIRTIAILLFKTDHDNKTNLIANSINEKLEEPLAHLEQIAKTLNENNSDMQTLQSTIKRVKEAVDGVYSSIVDVKDTIEILSPAINSLQSKIEDLSAKATSISNSNSIASNNRQTYSSITAANLPPQVDQALARAAV
jgi:methyl-accepting chemotaxis protein